MKKINYLLLLFLASFATAFANTIHIDNSDYWKPIKIDGQTLVNAGFSRNIYSYSYLENLINTTVAIGQSGLVSTTTDGVTWTSQRISTIDFRGICHNGSAFFIGTYENLHYSVYMSKDGYNWQAVNKSFYSAPDGGNSKWYRLLGTFNGRVFVRETGNGASSLLPSPLWISEDGERWAYDPDGDLTKYMSEEEATQMTNNLQKTEVTRADSKVIRKSSSSDYADLEISHDQKQTWESIVFFSETRNEPVSGEFHSAVCWDGNRFVLIAPDMICFSSDGENFNSSTASFGRTLTDITFLEYVDGIYWMTARIASGQALIYKSTDAVNWQEVYVSTDVEVINKILFNGSTSIAMGSWFIPDSGLYRARARLITSFDHFQTLENLVLPEDFSKRGGGAGILYNGSKYIATFASAQEAYSLPAGNAIGTMGFESIDGVSWIENNNYIAESTSEKGYDIFHFNDGSFKTTPYFLRRVEPGSYVSFYWPLHYYDPDSFLHPYGVFGKTTIRSDSEIIIRSSTDYRYYFSKDFPQSSNTSSTINVKWSDDIGTVGRQASVDHNHYSHLAFNDDRLVERHGRYRDYPLGMPHFVGARLKPLFLTPGQSASFYIEHQPDETLDYRWYVNGQLAAEHKSTGDKTIVLSGTTVNKKSFSFPFSQFSTVSVELVNQYGSVRSVPVGVYERIDLSELSVAPSITTHPESTTIAQGQTATLSVTASGSVPLTYQWYQGSSGDTSNPINGATSASYTTPALTANTSYWVRVTNGVGAVDSDTATVTVINPPVITQQPQSVSAYPGESVEFTVTATGGEPMSYQWYWNGDAVADAVGTSWTIPFVMEGGNVSVRVANADGIAISNTATLRYTPLSEGTQPLILTHPQDVYVRLGDDASFSVVTANVLRYQWYHGNVPMIGERSAQLSLSSVTNANLGNYHVKVASDAGYLVSNSAALNIVSGDGIPYISKQPTSVQAYPGETVSFSVTAFGGSPLSYQWYFNGEVISGADATEYTIPFVTEVGSLYVVISNAWGSVTSQTVQLTRRIDFTGDKMPIITNEPVDIWVREGMSASFTVGTQYAKRFQWYKDGVPLLGERSETLSIAAVANEDVGAYHLKAASNVGYVSSREASLFVVGDTLSILQHPQSVSIAHGAPASFTVSAVADVLLYQWYVGESGDTSQPISDATEDSLQTSSLIEDTAFWVRVGNGFDWINSNTAWATIDPSTNQAPFITAQPADANGIEGTTVSLSVTAGGTAPLSYQWYQGTVGNTSSPIANTASWTTGTLPLTVGQSEYSFWVRISNPFGNVDSKAAIIRVVNPPIITVQPSSSTLYLGQTANLELQATGSRPLTVRWYQGATGNAVRLLSEQSFTTGNTNDAINSSITSPELTETTNFWAEVSNEHGSVKSNTVSIVVYSEEEEKPLPPDLEERDFFGYNVATKVRTVATTAPNVDNRKGRVFIYEHSGVNWQESARFDGENAGDQFGTSVCIDSSVIAVGSPFNGGSGSVYFYEKNGTWQSVAKINSPDQIAGEAFGFATAMSNPYLVVTAPFNKLAGVGAGTAHVFKRNGNNWEQVQRLEPETVGAGEYFGMAASVDSSTLVIGSMSGNKGLGTLTIYTFQNNAWERTQTIVNPTTSKFVAYGQSVSVDGSWMATSSWRQDRVYVYAKSGGAGTNWTLAATLTPPDNQTGIEFGRSVSVKNGVLTIGAPKYGESGDVFVYTYKQGAWTYQMRLAEGKEIPSKGYGFSVSVDTNYAVVGAYAEDANATESGASYIYNLVGKKIIDTLAAPAAALDLQFEQMAQEAVAESEPMATPMAIEDFAYEADANQDGVNNLLAYTLGLDLIETVNVDNLPKVTTAFTEAMAMEPISMQAIGNEGTATVQALKLNYTYNRNRSAIGINYEVQVSSDLVNWQNNTIPPSFVKDNNDGKTETWGTVITAPDGASKVFVRLRVSVE